MRVNRKGQITIPKSVRELAGLLAHTEVEFEYSDGGLILRRAGAADPNGAARIRAANESARGSANEPMFKNWGTDRIMAFLRPE